MRRGWSGGVPLGVVRWSGGRISQSTPVGELRLVSGGRAVALQYGADWLASGFPLSEDLPLTPGLFVAPVVHLRSLPAGQLALDDVELLGRLLPQVFYHFIPGRVDASIVSVPSGCPRNCSAGPEPSAAATPSSAATPERPSD